MLEIEQAEQRLLKIVQHEAFEDEEDACMRLRTLDTFKDEDGLVRVKTKSLGEKMRKILGVQWFCLQTMNWLNGLLQKGTC